MTVRLTGLLLCLGSIAAAAPPLETRARAVLRKHCLRCHGGARTFGGFDVRSREAVLEVVEPGKPNESRMIELIEGGRMPLGGPRLPASDLVVLKEWIRAGAKARP